MQRYFIQLSYNGTNYHGWQIQPEEITVQETLEKALSVILREKILTTGAGRTDTGVHASFYIAHFDSQQDNINCDQLTYRLNSFLPNDLAIQRIFKVGNDVHARFDATYRTYKYYITKVKSPFNFFFSHYYRRPLNVTLMNEAAEALFDYIDFTSFSRSGTDVKTNNCKILYAKWEEDNDSLVFTIKADRFLRNMVRAIVGTMLDVGLKKISVEDFRKIIEAKDRSSAGASAVAKGLFLVDIGYPEEWKIEN